MQINITHMRKENEKRKDAKHADIEKKDLLPSDREE